MSQARYRVLEIVTDCSNPKTGEEILSLVHADERLSKLYAEGKIKQAYMILHDKDDYKEKDLFKFRKKHHEDPAWKVGDIKTAHLHIPMSFTGRGQSINAIAKVFHVPEQDVLIIHGNTYNKFCDIVRYLTHEDAKQQAEGKHLYADEEVHCYGSDGFREYLDKALENKARYGKANLSARDQMRMDVLLNGKTLAQCESNDPVGYAADMEKLAKLRARYLAKQPMPPVRINFYIEGRGGVGKGTVSRIIAKALFPEKADSEVYFETGGNGVSLDGYDGQPVIIWHDRRAAALLKELGGRGNVFNVLDTHPAAIRQNVKYSTASLVNSVNIINGIEPFKEFLDGLSGEYTDTHGEEHKAEDKGQAYRRIPLIICLHENDFDVLINKGFAEGTFEFEQYINYSRIVGNFGTAMRQLEGKARETVLLDMTNPIVDAYRKLEQKEQCKIGDVDKIPDNFKDYGRDVNEVVWEKGPACGFEPVYTTDDPFGSSQR